MKVFNASYDDSWNYGGCIEINCVVTANTESEAFGLLLESYPNLRTSKWLIEELDLTDVGVDQISIIEN